MKVISKIVVVMLSIVLSANMLSASFTTPVRPHRLPEDRGLSGSPDSLRVETTPFEYSEQLRAELQREAQAGRLLEPVSHSRSEHRQFALRLNEWIRNNLIRYFMTLALVGHDFVPRSTCSSLRWSLEKIGSFTARRNQDDCVQRLLIRDKFPLLTARATHLMAEHGLVGTVVMMGPSQHAVSVSRPYSGYMPMSTCADGIVVDPVFLKRLVEGRNDGEVRSIVDLCLHHVLEEQVDLRSKEILKMVGEVCFRGCAYVACYALMYAKIHDLSSVSNVTVVIGTALINDVVSDCMAQLFNTFVDPVIDRALAQKHAASLPQRAGVPSVELYGQALAGLSRVQEHTFLAAVGAAPLETERARTPEAHHVSEALEAESPEEHYSIVSPCTIRRGGVSVGTRMIQNCATLINSLLGR